MKSLTIIVLVAAAVFAFGTANAGANGTTTQQGSNGTNSMLGTPNATYININKISTYLRANGIADIDPAQANSGFIFPKGSSKAAIYESGFLWGARIAGDPQVRVGGSAFRSGLQTGKILSPGVAEDPNLPKNRIYRVRPDWRNADLSSEIRDEGRAAAEIRDQYEKDWNEWPAADGAPYKDVDSNRTYNPAVDIPGVPGADQTVWFVTNDLNTTNTQNLYGAQPLGIECQFTIWAYAQEGALGNMIFKSYLMINKSATRFDSMYVCQWSDPDLGNAADDLVGCDTSLSLGYVYNGGNTDATYTPLPPPAAGFDFFQGPVVSSPGNTAIFRGRVIQNARNLPMKAFFYFINRDPILADPTQGAPAGSTQFYNFFQGRIGLTGEFFRDPQNNPTTFTLTGDPVTGTGWLDGRQFPAGDRRMGLSAGPFNMAPGDSQEIVVAEIAAGAIPGVNRTGAVGLLKFFDKSAQLAYDNFFALPSPPPAPKVTVTELNNAILLDWGTDLAAVNVTEGSNNRGFRFQGYNVYQLPSASATIDQARKIATYDVAGDGVTRIIDQVFDTQTGVVSNKVVQLGTDSGLKRYLRLTTDAINGGTPLVNGIRYYFAVTAYSYSADPNAVPNNLENPLQVLTIIPHSANPGVTYSSTSGDTVQVSYSGSSDGLVVPLVVNPARVTGNTYNVAFADDGHGATVWRLVNTTKGDTLLRDQANQSGDDNYYVVDGLQVKVVGPPPGMKEFSIPAGERRWTWAGADAFHMEGFNGAIGWAGGNWLGVSTTTAAQVRNTLVKLAATDTNGNITNATDPNASFAYRYLRSATAPPARPEFAPFIVNATAGYAYQDFRKVPFAAYNTETNPPTRLAIGFLENNQPGGRVDGKHWPPYSNENVDNTAAAGPREWFFIFDKPYAETTDPALTVDALNTDLPMMWFGVVNRRGGNIAYSAGDEILLSANHVNAPGDVFSFVAPSVTFNQKQAKADVTKINVFPNPYYGVNTEELNKYNRFVTFSHLPDRAIIRIFNLAGVQVKEIVKDPSTTPGQFMRWDLANESGLPVGSGLYIAHIDMPDLGTTRILKLAIVQEQQILDRF